MHPSEMDIRSLSRIPLLREAGPEVLASLQRRVEWRSYETGSLIIDFGDTSNDVLFVIEGAVRVVMRTRDGKEVVCGDIAAGSFFGELAAIDKEPRSACVSALTRTRIAMLPGPAFLEAVLASPAMCHRLLRILTHRIRELTERLLEFATLPVRQRLCAELLRLSRPRAGGTGELVVSPPPPHHVLAARIGARREAVSREMSDLIRCGMLIVTRQVIVIVQPDAVRASLDVHLPASAAE